MKQIIVLLFLLVCVLIVQCVRETRHNFIEIVQISGERTIYTTPTIIVPTVVAEEEKKEVVNLQNKSQVVWCRRDSDNNMRKSRNSGVSGCFYGEWYKNVKMPSKAHYLLFKEIFPAEEDFLIAITLANWESGFNSEAVGCHKYGCDYWILQIRDSNGWDKMNDKEQLLWLKNRIAVQRSGICQKNSRKEELLCLFARHHGDRSDTASYPLTRYFEFEWYKNYISQHQIM